MPRSLVDYADYNITVYREPCPYQCIYCWAWHVPLFANRIQRGYYDPYSEAEKIALKAKADEKVVISFTSDPYPFQEAWINKTRNIIFNFRRNGCAKLLILTKNPLLALKDRDVMLSYIYKSRCYYVETWLGTTITSADTFHPFSTTFEPNAPRTTLRLKALQTYQNEDGKTWISIEPIFPHDHYDFYPETILYRTLEYLDPEKIALVVLGRLNFIKQIEKNLPFIFPKKKEKREEYIRKHYCEHIPITIDILREHGIPYHVKKELQKTINQCDGGD